MRIIEETYNHDFKIIKIVSAKYKENFLIKTKFNDYTIKTINFKPFLKNAIHPSVKKYLNEDLFKNFKIVNGNLNWNDYDLIFPIQDIYNGKI